MLLTHMLKWADFEPVDGFAETTKHQDGTT